MSAADRHHDTRKTLFLWQGGKRLGPIRELPGGSGRNLLGVLVPSVAREELSGVMQTNTPASMGDHAFQSPFGSEGPPDAGADRPSRIEATEMPRESTVAPTPPARRLSIRDAEGAREFRAWTIALFETRLSPSQGIDDSAGITEEILAAGSIWNVAAALEDDRAGAVEQ
jgi:hypothetical protein